MGIEPTSKAWEAFVLPLNYTRKTVYYGAESTVLRSSLSILPTVLVTVKVSPKGHQPGSIFNGQVFMLSLKYPPKNFANLGGTALPINMALNSRLSSGKA